MKNIYKQKQPFVIVDEYAWNKHEQKLKKQTKFTDSLPKIKALDNNDLRNEIQETLETLGSTAACEAIFIAEFP